MRQLRAIIAKELGDILKNRMLVFTSIVPAVVFLVVPMTIGLRGASDRSAGASMSQLADVLVSVSPELSGLPPAVLSQIFVFRQFVIFLLIIPIMTALAIAVHSIIGEKQTRSLEPLLATPISSMQLLLGKSLSAALPSVSLTWVMFVLYAVGIGQFALAGVLPHVLTPLTFFIILVICPLVAILGLSAGVIVSSRTNDPRTAQQIGGIFILPIVALFTAQMQGFYFVRFPIVIMAAVALALVDLIVLGIGVALFNRETILVRWK